MSTKQQFLVQIFDHPGTIQKRIEVRQSHLAAVGENQAVKAGGNFLRRNLSLTTIGAFFSKDPTPEEPMPFAVDTSLSFVDSFRAVY